MGIDGGQRAQSLAPAQRRYSVSGAPPAWMLGGVPTSSAGETVTETTATHLSAVWRACSLIAGSIASLPLRTLITEDDGTRRRAGSWLDDPGKALGLTRFEWVELAVWHLLLNGNAFGQHIYGGGGQLVSLNWVDPLAVEVEADERAPGGRRFKLRTPAGGVQHFDGSTMTQLMAASRDGVRGMSVISEARTSLGTALAGDRSAANGFRNGALLGGIVTPEDELTEAEREEVRDEFVDSVTGAANAGGLSIVSRKLKFTPWAMSRADAQFLQSRVFQVEEVGRWFGVPPHLLGQTEKSTSWGSGIEEQNRGFARSTLAPWTTRIEQRLTRLVSRPRIAEFDYSAFLQPSPEDEINLLIAQVNAGLVTPNEARRIRNMPAIAGGDALRTPAGASPSPTSDEPSDPTGGDQ